MKFLLFGLLAFIGVIFSFQNAFAIKGAYLPDAELSGSVCKIMVGKMIQTYTPTYENGYATGKAPFDFSDENVMLCSSTLIAPNAILTAAHCFVGNNRQDVARGRFPYPKMVNGKLIEGCDPKTWPKKPACIASKEFGIVKNVWENITVVCKTSDGKEEVRPLIEETGYPNPLFKADNMANSITHSNFDVTIWRFEKPITTTPILAMETDESIAAAAMPTSRNSCRSFGYGLDNEEKSGTLRGAYTPITKASRSILLSDIASTEFSDFPTGRTDHGDSGGALVCKSTDGKDKLYGVVSRGGASSQMETMTLSEISMFAKVAYNASWIKQVLATGPMARPSDSNWWDAYVVQYEVDMMKVSFQEARDCIKNARMNPDDASAYLQSVRTLEDQFKSATRLSRQYGNDPGLLRIKVRDIFTNSQKLIYNCSQY